MGYPADARLGRNTGLTKNRAVGNVGMASTSD